MKSSALRLCVAVPCMVLLSAPFADAAAKRRPPGKVVVNPPPGPKTPHAQAPGLKIVPVSLPKVVSTATSKTTTVKPKAVAKPKPKVTVKKTK